jgi:uncharacterized membrane protein
MESRIQFLGHPVHQLSVGLPIGALAFAVVSDVLAQVSGKEEYARATRLALDFGLAGALVAAPFGAVDFLAIPCGTRAKRVGFWHAVGNVGALGLFLGARLLHGRSKPRAAATAFALTGFAAIGVTAWLGGELVNRHGIGVKDVMGLNAPSSLPFGASAASTLQHKV